MLSQIDDAKSFFSSTWSNAIPLTAAFASATVLTALLCKLARSPGAFSGGNRFARQLWHLAVADILYAVVSGLFDSLLPILTTHGINPFSMSTEVKSYVCQSSNFLSLTGQYTSMLVECHIAVTFTLTVYRCINTLEKLHGYISFVWPIGLVLGVLDDYWARTSWQVGLGCITKEDTDLLFVCGTSVCTLLCLCCYIASTRGVLETSGVVQRRVWSRAQLYPIVPFMTTGPLMLYRFGFPGMNVVNTTTLTTFCVVQTLYNSSGLIVSVVYAAQRQYCLHGDRVRAVDFYVAFRDPGSIVEVCGSDDTFSTRSDLALSRERVIGDGS